MSDVADLKKELAELGSKKKAEASSWFFKTGPGQYGEGDQFLGVSVPEQRKLSKKYSHLPLEQVEQLLLSPIHEERLTALMILDLQFTKGGEATKKEIFDFYLDHTDRINNWDLVDSSAGYIVGTYLLDKPRDVLYKLARSRSLWEKRIALVATLAFIVKGESLDTFKIAELLLADKEDLIQKAMGWMLREVGKRVSRGQLVAFLNKHYREMGRTALRYSIEHFPENERQKYLRGEI